MKRRKADSRCSKTKRNAVVDMAAARFRRRSCRHKWTGRTVGVDNDPCGRASRLDESEATRRNAAFEEPRALADHHRKNGDAIFVDEVGADQRLQQLAAAPDVQFGSI